MIVGTRQLVCWLTFLALCVQVVQHSGRRQQQVVMARASPSAGLFGSYLNRKAVVSGLQNGSHSFEGGSTTGLSP